jgi:hypothetical protein
MHFQQFTQRGPEKCFKRLVNRASEKKKIYWNWKKGATTYNLLQQSGPADSGRRMDREDRERIRFCASVVLDDV